MRVVAVEMIRNISVQIFGPLLQQFQFLVLNSFYCYISKTKMVQNYFSQCMLQNCQNTRQFLPQEIELYFSVQLPALEAQRMRDQMVLGFFSVFFTKCRQGLGPTYICILKASWEPWLNQHTEFLVPLCLPAEVLVAVAPCSSTAHKAAFFPHPGLEFLPKTFKGGSNGCDINAWLVAVRMGPPCWLVIPCRKH